MQTINNYAVYLDNMKNGVYDKLFFTDKIFDPWSSLLDIGCADGFITNKIQELFPNKQITGYDVDGEMLKIAKEQYPTINFTNQFVESDILYLSSIIHEVYNYLNLEQIEQFWQTIFNSNYKFIIIRDMFYDEYLNYKNIPINELFLFKKFIQKFGLEKCLVDYENFWGKIVNYKSLIHFLLKYQYTDNWAREVRENYLPISFNSFVNLLPSNLKITYFEHYTLSYFKHKWFNDVGLELDEKIHCKIILKKI